MSRFEGIERRSKENVAVFFNKCAGRFRLNEKLVKEYVHTLERAGENCSEQTKALSELIEINKRQKINTKKGNPIAFPYIKMTKGKEI